MGFQVHLITFSDTIGFCLPPNGILVLIRSTLSTTFPCIDQVVLEKAENSCSCQGEASRCGFLSPPRWFLLCSMGFCLVPNGILVLIRSKLSMKLQCIDQVLLEKAKNHCNR